MARSISAEEVLSVLIETLVNPLLAKMPPFGGIKAAETNVSNQMEVVTWLYNYYIRRELSHLEVLDWETICRIACFKQTRLSKFMGPSVFPGTQCLTLTQQKIKNVCERAASLKNSGNIRATRTVTKVCVCLLNFRQDKCVLVLGGTSTGLWSFIEKSRHLQSVKDASEGVLLSDEEMAFQAVEEHTGIKRDILQLGGSFLINDDLNGNGGSTMFYIMLCSGTYDLSCVVKVERITWILIDNILPKVRDPLIDTMDRPVRSTPALQYSLLHPFCSSLEKWLTMQKNGKHFVQPEPEHKKIPAILGHQQVLLGRQQDVEDVWQSKHAVEPEPECKMEKSLSKIGDSPDVELYKEEEVQLLKINTESQGMNTCIDVSTSGRPQSLAESKRSTHLLVSSAEQNKAEQSGFVQKLEDIQGQIDSKVNTVGMKTQLSIGSPQSSTLLTNVPEPSLRNGENINDLDTVASKQGEDRSRQLHQAVDEVALSLNMSGSNDKPHITRLKKRQEEHILDNAGALLSMKMAYRNIKKRRKMLSKELSKHTHEMDELYTQIAECDTYLATLIGGGKVALQLAVDFCKKDLERQMSSSDVSVDHSQRAAYANSSQTDRAETSNKNRTFHMLKSSIQELNEVCAKNAWSMPIYGVFMNKNNHGQNLFSGKVRIRNDIFELSEIGEASHTSKKAKLSAAASMLSTLHRLKARNGIL